MNWTIDGLPHFIHDWHKQCALNTFIETVFWMRDLWHSLDSIFYSLRFANWFILFCEIWNGIGAMCCIVLCCAVLCYVPKPILELCVFTENHVVWFQVKFLKFIYVSHLNNDMRNENSGKWWVFLCDICYSAILLCTFIISSVFSGSLQDQMYQMNSIHVKPGIFICFSNCFSRFSCAWETFRNAYNGQNQSKLVKPTCVLQ